MTKLNNHEVEITFEEFQQAIKRIEGCLIDKIIHYPDCVSLVDFYLKDQLNNQCYIFSTNYAWNLYENGDNLIVQSKINAKVNDQAIINSFKNKNLKSISSVDFSLGKVEEFETYVAIYFNNGMDLTCYLFDGCWISLLTNEGQVFEYDGGKFYVRQKNI